MNAIYPVYALRQSIEVGMVAIMLTGFSVGAIATQLPLGELSDRIGRKNVLMVALLGGAAMFGLGSFFESSAWLTVGVFVAAGMFVGSTFSLGISYMADLMPKDLLPTGNLLCGIAFSIGSLAGPVVGGLYIQYLDVLSFLLLFAAILLVIFTIIAFRSGTREKLVETVSE